MNVLLDFNVKRNHKTFYWVMFSLLTLMMAGLLAILTDWTIKGIRSGFLFYKTLFFLVFFLAFSSLLCVLPVLCFRNRRLIVCENYIRYYDHFGRAHDIDATLDELAFKTGYGIGLTVRHIPSGKKIRAFFLLEPSLWLEAEFRKAGLALA